VGKINQVWSGDITYLPTDEGWLYLATVLDLGTRECIGFSFDSQMPTSLVISALEMAYIQQEPDRGCLFHSDRSSQYCSHRFQELLSHLGLISSMSGKGNCYDNAPVESLWATLKRETLPLSGSFKSRKEAKKVVRQWLMYYNSERPHRALGNLSPFEYKRKCLGL